MTSTNWRRIGLGGFCAGLLFVVGGMASAFLMGLPEAFARFGVEPTAAAAMLHTLLRMGLGFATVLVYVGFRGGMGPGSWTAVRAGLLVWFVGYVPGSAVLHELGVLGDGQFAFALGWGMLEAVGAALLGASLYRPASGPAPEAQGDTA